MSSFYGGPAGLSFQLQEYASYTAMQDALNTSLIGSYAIIHYYNGSYEDDAPNYHNSEFYRCDYINNERAWTLIGNFQGEKGNTGEKGDTGATPQLSIAGVTTGDAGTNANVILGGTAENPTLSFTIPRGDTGTTGATGAKGDPGTVEIIAAYDISTTNANNTVAYVSNEIEGQIGYEPPNSGQVIAVNWIDSADSSITLAYWYYKVDGNWVRSLLTGNVGSLLTDEEAASSTNKAYTARYVSAVLAEIYTKTEADNKYLTKVSLPIIQSNETYTNVYCSGGQAQWDAWLAALETEEE